MFTIGGVSVEQELNKKQNRKLTVFACMLSVISIGLLIFGFMAVSSSKVVMLQSLSNLSGKLDPFLEENRVLLDKIASSKDVGYNTNVNVNVNEMILPDTSFGLSINYLENKDDQKSRFNLSLSSNNEEILGGKLALANQKAYGFINNITPRYYSTLFDYSSFLSSLSSKDSEKVWSLFKDTINDYIENDDINKEKVVINYDGKDKKVTKLSYSITSNDIKTVINNFFDNLKKEKNLFNNIASVINISEEDLKLGIDTFLESIDGSDEAIIYNVYYYGFNKIVQYELESSNHTIMIQYKTGKKDTFKLISNNVTFLSLEVTKNNKQYDFNGYVYGNDTKLPFSGSLIDDKMNIVFNTDSGDLKFDITKMSDNNNYKYTMNIKLTVSTEGVSVELGTLEVKSEYYFDQKVDVSLNDSVDINEISEEDYNTICNNFLNHPLYSIIESFIDKAPDDIDISL